MKFINIFFANNTFTKMVFCLSAFLIIVNISAKDNNKSYSNGSYISLNKSAGGFTLAEPGQAAPLYASYEDYPGVLRVLNLLQSDISKVTDIRPEIVLDNDPHSKEIVIIGTLGKNQLIDKLVVEKKLDVKMISGKWETYLIEVVENPFKGVNKALVIAGSDKRGTIYGMFDLSSEIGVSPLYWWCDVPAKKHSEIYIKPGKYSKGEPKVKYRGIFINDEAPALSGWAAEKFGSEMFNHKMYDHVFELILRLKGNFLWPGMWGRAFYDDDPVNPKLADEYGIVISTSHHEPMMRAHDEWRRYGSGPWDYDKNSAALKEFWKKGIERMGNNENIVTLAMRGDGDAAMSPDANLSLLEKIVSDQRQILGEVTGRDVTKIPQVWALYKEVQEYYDKGMRVPDDVTLLLCDDNWGNQRFLPKAGDKLRKGGYGIYYHFDYVGAPRNYKWINTNQIERVWEQMHLAYEHGVDRIWIVNVGDIKPLEFPIQFFLDYAWNPEEFPAEKLPEYTRHWAEKQFGAEYANDIADIINKYTKYSSRRKPELLSPDTYNLVNYNEFEKVVSDYNFLVQRADKINNSLPAEYRDAFYHLVLHPVSAAANLYELYYTAAKNRQYASEGRASANSLSEKVKYLFAKDSLISFYYNKILAAGKWPHMMDQTHIGYTNWQQPDKNIIPETRNITIPDTSDMGVAIEGSDKWWPHESSEAVLPEFDKFNHQNYFVEIFNRGSIPFGYEINSGQPWVKIDNKYGTVETEKRLYISIDWQNAPSGKSRVPIYINGANKSKVTVYAEINNPSSPSVNTDGFIEGNGYVSMEAENYSNAINSASVKWIKIPNLGRTGSGITPMPVTAETQSPEGQSPRLEYKFFMFSEGDVKIKTYLSPTLKFGPQGLRYAISLDNEVPQIINIHSADTLPDYKYPMNWMNAVANNIKIITSLHSIKSAGEHTLKFWMVDPAIVLQKIVIETDKAKPAYLGPPQSYNNKLKKNSDYEATLN